MQTTQATTRLPTALSVQAKRTQARARDQRWYLWIVVLPLIIVLTLVASAASRLYALRSKD